MCESYRQSVSCSRFENDKIIEEIRKSFVELWRVKLTGWRISQSLIYSCTKITNQGLETVATDVKTYLPDIKHLKISLVG